MSTVLAKDEQVVKDESFIVNPFLFWFKARYTLTNKRITGEQPNTVLGIIPIGKAQFSQPLKTVASVSCSTKFSLKRLLLGLVFGLIGISLMGSMNIPSIVLLIFAVGQILYCYTATFGITNNSGQTPGYEISILEKSKVEAFVHEVNNTIADS